MSEENSSADVTEKVKALEKEYAGFRSAMARSRNTRVLILFGAIALVVVIGYMFYSLASEVMSKPYQENLLKLAQERLENNREEYVKEVQKLVDSSAPKLKDAFYKQTKKDMPKYTAAFAAERDEFAKNIQAELKSQVNEHYKGTVEKYKERLAKEFPELSTEALRDRVMKEVGNAFNELVKEFYVDALAEGIDEIYALWDDFPAAEKPQGSQSEDVLIGLLLELVSKKMAN